MNLELSAWEAAQERHMRNRRCFVPPYLPACDDIEWSMSLLRVTEVSGATPDHELWLNQNNRRTHRTAKHRRTYPRMLSAWQTL
jgi:hypothetical protein